MSGMVSLPQGAHYIHYVLPSTKIYYKLDGLLSNMRRTNNNEQNLIALGVEHNNRKRHFLHVTFDELSKLVHLLEPSKCTLYEILCENRLCKLYFDIDIHIEESLSLNIQQSLSILQNLFHDIISNSTHQFLHSSTSTADSFLVLSASTELKHSYHLIYTNTSVRFESQQTISKFIKSVLYHCSHFIISHSCHQQFVQSFMHTNDNFNNCLNHLQTVLTHMNFCSCRIPSTNITCSDFQQLLFKSILTLPLFIQLI